VEITFGQYKWFDYLKVCFWVGSMHRGYMHIYGQSVYLAVMKVLTNNLHSL